MDVKLYVNNKVVTEDSFDLHHDLEWILAPIREYCSQNTCNSYRIRLSLTDVVDASVEKNVYSVEKSASGTANYAAESGSFSVNIIFEETFRSVKEISLGNFLKVFNEIYDALGVRDNPEHAKNNEVAGRVV